jgi:hypothetical protein
MYKPKQQQNFQNFLESKRTSVTREEVLAAISGSKGLILNIEKALGCTRSCIQEWIDKDPEIKQEIKDEQEREKDMVMDNLIEDAKNGDKFARKLFLEAQARDRGFGDKIEISGANGQPLVMLHAVATNLTANEQNDNASREKRVESWSHNAIEYHEKQTEELKGLSTDEIVEKLGK